MSINAKTWIADEEITHSKLNLMGADIGNTSDDIHSQYIPIGDFRGMYLTIDATQAPGVGYIIHKGYTGLSTEEVISDAGFASLGYHIVAIPFVFKVLPQYTNINISATLSGGDAVFALVQNGTLVGSQSFTGSGAKSWNQSLAALSSGSIAMAVIYFKVTDAANYTLTLPKFTLS